MSAPTPSERAWNYAGAALAAYVAAHNEFVRTRDPSPLGELFHADAEMRFDGVEVPNLVGRDAILAAFRDHGPNDELMIDEPTAIPAALATPTFAPATGDAARITATYRWRASPAVVGGTIEVIAQDTRIKGLVIRACRPLDRP